MARTLRGARIYQSVGTVDRLQRGSGWLDIGYRDDIILIA